MREDEERGPNHFSDEALAEISILGASIQNALLERVEVKGVTIHGPLRSGSASCDFAIWVERSTQGGYTVLMSIVDVGSFLTREWTPVLDREAGARAYDQYTKEGVFVPFLPEALAVETLRLVEGQPCPAVTLVLPLDVSCEVGVPLWQQTSVRPWKQWTYEEVDQTMADEHAAGFELLHDAFRVALHFWRARVLRGADACYDLETGWVNTEDGDRVLLSEEKRFQGYIIEQEFLLFANETIATYLATRDLPALYRNHPPKATFAPIKAMYASTPASHAGLHVPVYLHATHPLHRYADLINQRLLLAAIRGEPSPSTGEELDVLATSLNARELRIKAAKPAHFRREHDEMLFQQSEEDGLALLDQKHFHSVLRKAAEEHALSVGIEQEIHRRLEQQLLKENDLYTLVFRFQNSGDEWERVTSAVCRVLENDPTLAMMIFSRGQQSGKWTLVSYPHMSHIGAPFHAQVVLQYEEREYTSSLKMAPKRAHARYQAIADVLVQIARVKLPRDVSK